MSTATTNKKKEERRVIAPGITRDSERVYYGKGTYLGRNGEVSILRQDIINAAAEAYERAFASARRYR